MLVQHRKESVSVTSHYRLKEGWGRELTNNLKEITNTFTSHKPPMSTNDPGNIAAVLWKERTEVLVFSIEGTCLALPLIFDTEENWL